MILINREANLGIIGMTLVSAFIKLGPGYLMPGVLNIRKHKLT
ncbi:hypothetical protein SAMN05444266_10233 [Chitinophaga jiangningensis]|uniref:Uncharacterized protein n=1 Tax=Chitinophaga jiangningensis TaxID=1419482 RepID=A0A1M6XV51_9BACT|nr:hypothetical protein SAMN05444266_10233 [Chitinophaga jiangningensis]